MDEILFLLVMIGVAWVAIWTCVDHSKPSGVWWPFDLRSTDAPEEKKKLPHRRFTPQANIDAPRPWRRSRG